MRNNYLSREIFVSRSRVFFYAPPLRSFDITMYRILKNYVQITHARTHTDYFLFIFFFKLRDFNTVMI